MRCWEEKWLWVHNYAETTWWLVGRHTTNVEWAEQLKCWVSNTQKARCVQVSKQKLCQPYYRWSWMKTLVRSLVIFTLPVRTLWCFLVRTCLLPHYPPPVLALKTGRRRLDTSNARITVWLLLRWEVIEGEPWSLYLGLTTNVSNCKVYWDDHHFRRSINCPDMPVIQQVQMLVVESMLKRLPFQTLTQSPARCPWALS